MNDEDPKLVVHSLCGNELFLYFGTYEDAKKLRNINNISTLEGEGIRPEDIVLCPNCKEYIRVEHLSIVCGPALSKEAETRAEFQRMYNLTIQSRLARYFKLEDDVLNLKVIKGSTPEK